ncbi:MAG: hypothetical protein GY910_14190 [bacterium]|nr:hypothetical protein [Deltaproteobacteria bacterium]MCP4906122.1 hypothetical protein [bacterium]
MPDGKTTDGSEPFRAMLVEFAESGEAGKVEGLDLDDPKRAMRAPGAVETVMAIQAMEADFRAGPGQPAPDFTLPYLPGHGGFEGRRSACRSVSRIGSWR